MIIYIFAALFFYAFFYIIGIIVACVFLLCWVGCQFIRWGWPSLFPYFIISYTLHTLPCRFFIGQPVNNAELAKADKTENPLTKISQKAVSGFSDQVEATMGFRFDYADPNQQKFLEDRAAKMVKGIDKVTRQDIHDIVVN